jgi:hypothetical protein
MIEESDVIALTREATVKDEGGGSELIPQV